MHMSVGLKSDQILRVQNGKGKDKYFLMTTIVVIDCVFSVL